MFIFSLLDHKGKFSIPVLDVKSKQLVLNVNQTLVLNCRWVSGRSREAGILVLLKNTQSASAQTGQLVHMEPRAPQTAVSVRERRHMVGASPPVSGENTLPCCLHSFPAIIRYLGQIYTVTPSIH